MTEAERDHEALHRLARGDTGALGELYDRHARRVYHLLLAGGLGESEAQDVLQEAFLAMAERGRRLAQVDNALAYLLGIARKLATRRRATNEPAQTAPEPVAEAADADLSLAVRDALRQLPPEQAEVVILKVYHGFTFAEIGQALGIPLDTAASRYRYALSKLRTIWGDE